MFTAVVLLIVDIVLGRHALSLWCRYSTINIDRDRILLNPFPIEPTIEMNHNRT